MFLQEIIEYLRRIITVDGVLPDQSRAKAVRELKSPKNLKQLAAFLGKVNYYHNFLPHCATIVVILNHLHRKNIIFKWDVQHKAFEDLKLNIIHATKLAHFQEELPLVLPTDVSHFGFIWFRKICSIRFKDIGQKLS